MNANDNSTSAVTNILRAMRTPETWLDMWRVVSEEAGLSAYSARTELTAILTQLEERLRDVEAGRPVNVERLMTGFHESLSRLECRLEILEGEARGQTFDEFLIEQKLHNKAPGPRLSIND